MRDLYIGLNKRSKNLNNGYTDALLPDLYSLLTSVMGHISPYVKGMPTGVSET
jgi:hypothetical protein